MKNSIETNPTVMTSISNVFSQLMEYCSPMIEDTTEVFKETGKATACTAGLTMRTARVSVTGIRIAAEECYGALPSDTKSIEDMWKSAFDTTVDIVTPQKEQE